MLGNADASPTLTHIVQPVLREDASDVVFSSESGKWKAVLTEIKRMHKTGRPVLVGTTSVERSEQLADMLQDAGIKYQVRRIWTGFEGSNVTALLLGTINASAAGRRWSCRRRVSRVRYNDVQRDQSDDYGHRWGQAMVQILGQAKTHAWHSMISLARAESRHSITIGFTASSPALGCLNEDHI